MARVHVEEDIYLNIEHMNVTIDRKKIVQVKNKDTGDMEDKEVYVTISNGNYMTIQGAIIGLIRLKLSKSTASTLSELAADMIRIEEEVKELIKF